MAETPLLARPSHTAGPSSLRAGRERAHVLPAMPAVRPNRPPFPRDVSADVCYHSADVSSSIQDYDVGELLGTGGFGCVYRAYSRRGHHNGQAVAIKMINKQKMITESMKRRVINEVEIHWQLRHHSILELYNYFEDSEYVYLVMELCTGGELYRYLQNRHQPLSEPETRKVMIQLVEGLLHLHTHGIIHRDLKLSNILLTENLDLKIADFGLAARINAGGGEQKTMCGTPNYISPEIISRQPYGLAADVWSLGCIFVTFLTGKPPFESQKVRSTLDKVSRAEYTLPASLSAEAKDLTRQFLQLDPKKRLPLEDILSHQFFDRAFPVHRLKKLGSSPRLLQKANVLMDSRPLHASDQHRFPQKQQQAARASSNQIRSLELHGKENLPPEINVPSSDQKSLRQEIKGRAPVPSSQSGLKPFSTARLKSIRQATKHGIVEIVRQSEMPGKPPNLLLAFTDDRNVLCVSGDGRRVTIYQRVNQPSTWCSQGCKPENLSLALGPEVAWYDLENIPPKYVKRYKYASKFVALVRSKTPKIVFYSPQAKCVLMENGPGADFEMAFYNGVKVHNSAAHSRLEIRMPAKLPNGDDEVFNLDTSMTKHIQNLPPELVSVVRHVQECLQICMDVEKSGKVEENERNGGSWPLILKSSAAEDTTGVAANRIPETAADSDGFQSVGSRDGPGSVHPSNMSTCLSEGVGRWSSAASSISSRHQCPSLRAGSAPSAPATSTGHEAGIHERKARSLPSTSAPVPLAAARYPAQARGPVGRDPYREYHGANPNCGGLQAKTDRFASRQLSAPSARSRDCPEASQPRSGPHSGSATSTFSSTTLVSSAKAGPQIRGSSRAAHSNAASSAPLTGVRPTGPAYAFMNGVGWLVKSGTASEADEKFTMLFVDGTRVVVQVKKQMLVWHERRARGDGAAAESGEFYPIDKSLPGFLKAKLAYFPEFVKLLKDCETANATEQKALCDGRAPSPPPPPV